MFLGGDMCHRLYPLTTRSGNGDFCSLFRLHTMHQQSSVGVLDPCSGRDGTGDASPTTTYYHGAFI